MMALPINELFRQAEMLESQGRLDEACRTYKNWLAFNPSEPLLHAVYFNYSVVLARSGDRSGAINALHECSRINPDFAPAYINLGRQLEDCGQTGQALTKWLELTNRLHLVSGENIRHKLMVLQQLGRVLEGENLDGPAEDALRQSLDIKLEQPEVIQHWIALRQRQCKWPVIAGWDHIPAKSLLAGISPLSAAVMLDDPMFQLARSYTYARETISAGNRPAQNFDGRRKRLSGRKLRVGYVSSDLREHAVGFGLAEVMELHDRSSFEIYAYYCGIARPDSTQQRIRANVDLWTDINGMTDDEAAGRIQADEIDILVDLNGYTRDARTAVFARKPAPVIVNWFGFPGTMGTPYHHYIVADPTIIPEGDEIYYSERVLRLPCYQPNDRKRPVSQKVTGRGDHHLPEDAFVFACLNGTQKITPAVLQGWMQILLGVDKSVLWLLGATNETNARLREMASRSGVTAERLIFAGKVPNPEHLARYRHADLFLDTFPYGAHTTAADALWMGVPVLTVPGRTFASRVCASLVTAAGIPEFVCSTASEYVARAIRLGNDRELAKQTRCKLEDLRSTSLLFDTPRLVAGLERLYVAMWEDFAAGRLETPDLTNLSDYLEAGLEINTDKNGEPANDVYRQRYVEALGNRDRFYRLHHDKRLWPEQMPATDFESYKRKFGRPGG